MARKKSFTADAEQAAQVIENLVGAVPLSSSSYSPASDAPKTSKLIIPLTDDGRIDLTSVRVSTREKIVDAVRRTPELRPQTVQGSSEWDLADCGHAYRILGELEAWMLGSDVWKYSEEEIIQLKEPTAEVLNKYFSGVAGPESRLCLAIAGLHLKKYIAYKAILSLQRHLTVQDKPAVLPNGHLRDVEVNAEPGVDGTAEPGSQSWQLRQTR